MGEQITKALLGIQDSFEAQIDKLRNLDYTVLDVTTSRWHDDYNSFKDVVKDLEVRQEGRCIKLYGALMHYAFMLVLRRVISGQ